MNRDIKALLARNVTAINFHFILFQLQHLRNESIVLTWHENFPVNAMTHTDDVDLKDIDVETFSDNAVINIT